MQNSDSLNYSLMSFFSNGSYYKSIRLVFFLIPLIAVMIWPITGPAWRRLLRLYINWIVFFLFILQMRCWTCYQYNIKTVISESRCLFMSVAVRDLYSRETTYTIQACHNLMFSIFSSITPREINGSIAFVYFIHKHLWSVYFITNISV